MCGLAGWLAPPGMDPDELGAAVDRMSAALVHRGPDDAGRWVDASAGIGLGFRRLSILDLSPTGRQPMESADGRYACVFNGEIYNHRDLRAELERGGVRFRGSSDTEVIVESAAAFGAPGAVGRLWGMFALAIWDRAERCLLLARDRLGKKPLYAARIGESGWLFGSELKAFHALDRFRREIDPRAVAAYLRFGYVPAPLAIFRDAWKVEPGTFTLLRFGHPVRTERYWDVPVAWWDRAYKVAEPVLPLRFRQRQPGDKIRKAAALVGAARSKDALYWRLVSQWPAPGRLLPGAGPGRLPWESAGIDAEVSDFRERMTLYDLLVYLPDDILVKVDRATMAASLELRSPLLDHRIAEWTWTLPFAMKVRRGASKWILRQVLSRYVPPALVERPKAGFGVPLDHWLRGPLRDWAEDALRPGRLEEAGLRPAPILAAWRRHLAGLDEQYRLWVILMFLAWRKRWGV